MKLRMLLILLLSAAVLIAGAFLPQFAGSWQDSHESGMISYAQITDVKLSFADTEGGLNMYQKLPLLARFDSYTEIPVSLASQTETQVQNIAKNFIEACQKAGLLSYDLSTNWNRAVLQSFLVFWDAEETWSNIFWSVQVEFSLNCSLDLVIDDQTGTICSAAFMDSQVTADTGASYGWYNTMGIHTDSQMDAALEALCTVYLENLGSEFSSFDPHSLVIEASSQEFAYEDWKSRSTQISWSDLVFGETIIHFSVYPSGFQVNPF